jgi:hypothetical protein
VEWKQIINLSRREDREYRSGKARVFMWDWSRGISVIPGNITVFVASRG